MCHGRDMAADGVEGQRRGVWRQLCYLAVRQKTELHECLKTVADADDKTVSHLDEAHELFGNLGVAKHRRDELAGAVRLVAAREAARQHENLGILNAARKGVHRLFDGFRRQVSNDETRRVCPRTKPSALGIVLAVRAGEDGNNDARTRDGRRPANRAALFIADGNRTLFAALLRRLCREDALERLGISFKKLL